MRVRIFGAAILAASMFSTSIAQAHFLWLLTQPAEKAEKIQLFFGEEAAPEDPELLDYIKNTKVWAIGSGGKATEIELEKKEDLYEGEIPERRRGQPLVTKHTFGLMTRDFGTFLLEYYGKTYPSSLPGTWQEVGNEEHLPLEIVPSLQGNQLTLTVNWKGLPTENSEVTFVGPGFDSPVKKPTNEDGQVVFELKEGGVFSIRARYSEETAGEYEGKPYTLKRHHSTLSLRVTPGSIVPAEHQWPDLDKAITSFGAAIDGDWLYVYGGHHGKAHHYSREGQSGEFQRLNLKNPEKWEALPGGPKLTGLALVAHNGKLYRVGGFSADNGDEEKQNLISQSSFARFDPATGTWEELPALPAGRSSHDAAVLGDTLYVVGGWQLKGSEKSVWHDTAWSVDLAQPELVWKEIKAPPFTRRALSLAAFNGNIYCLGGMQDSGSVTTQTAIYNPATQEWSEGPQLLGDSMDGFGSSAFAVGDGLYVSTMSGSIQRLNPESNSWEFVGQLETPRFFHRLLPVTGQEFLTIGGANMEIGKIENIERFPVSGIAQ